MRLSRPLRVALAFLCLCSAPATLRGQVRSRPLDHDDFERWQSIRGQSMSPDGDWVAYELAAPGILPHVRLQPLPSGPPLKIPRGRSAVFTSD